MHRAYTVHHANVLDFAAAAPEQHYHALLCDPPYELGFMGKGWDNTGIAFRPETWAAFKRVMLPGAFGFAFASTKGYHRMATAIEAAGFILHPFIIWCFGSGFPKSTRVQDGGAAWDGHRYGQQALKPALEPIAVFQRPYEGKPSVSIKRHGAGALNIEGGRVPISVPILRQNGRTRDIYGTYAPHFTENHSGRWPANLILAHAPTCTDGACVDGCPVKALGEQSGEGEGSGPRTRQHVSTPSIAKGKEYQRISIHIGDSGTAARYFFNADYAAERLESAEPFLYTGKASRREREAGEQRVARVAGVGALRDGGRESAARVNLHPTVKPLALTHHLATLLLPPAEYAPRRLFVPFAGVGSEVIGAMKAGWDVVDGAELDPTYCNIAAQRITYWAGHKLPTRKPKQPAPAKQVAAPLPSPAPIPVKAKAVKPTKTKIPTEQLAFPL